MKESRKPKRLLLIAGVAAIIASAAVAAGLAYSARQPQLTSLRSDNDELHVAVASLEDEVSDLIRRGWHTPFALNLTTPSVTGW